MTEIRYAYPEETGRWDDYLTRNPDGGNVLQSQEFATSKTLGGWKPRYVMINDALAVTFVERTVQGLGKYWYAMKGPDITEAESLVDLLPELTAFAKKHGVFAIKIEPPIEKTTESVRLLTEAGLIHSRDVQTPSTVYLDLTPSLDDIFASLNQKGRHAIRRAERDGVTVQRVEYSRDNAMSMYTLLKETAEGRWTLRSFDYFDSYWKKFASMGTGSLFFAFYEGEVVAGAYCMSMGKKATYKDGASIRKRTAYGASHLLQWEAIKWMKSLGMESYDFCGTPPSDKLLDESHPHYGLGRFKTSFNKSVVDYVGGYDVVVNSTKYKAWAKVGERAVIRLNQLVYGDYWY